MFPPILFFPKMAIPEKSTSITLSNNLRSVNDDNWNSSGLRGDTLPANPIYQFQESLQSANNTISQQPSSFANNSVLIGLGLFAGIIIAIKILFD